MTALTAAWADEQGQTVRLNLAGSNVLAQQIEAARRADLFISADDVWMDYLADRDLIDTTTRATLLSNTLVVITTDGQHTDYVQALTGARYVSIADPEAVPAGRYARASLQAIPHGSGTLWDAVSPHIAPAPDATAALAQVRGDIVGIVYGSDAMGSTRVRVVGELPAAVPIRYAVAMVHRKPQCAAAKSLLKHLQSPEAWPMFAAHGFTEP